MSSISHYIEECKEFTVLCFIQCLPHTHTLFTILSALVLLIMFNTLLVYMSYELN